MGFEVKKIWIESDDHGPLGGSEIDDNSDVIVTLKDGRRFIATIFTYKNIETLRLKNNKTGECMDGKYFWASDMFLVERIERNEIEKIIEHLIEEEEFELIFSQIK